MISRRGGFTMLEAMLVLALTSSVAVMVGLILNQVRGSLRASVDENMKWHNQHQLGILLRRDAHQHELLSINDSGDLIIGSHVRYSKSSDGIVRESEQNRETFPVGTCQWSVSGDGREVTLMFGRHQILAMTRQRGEP